MRDLAVDTADDRQFQNCCQFARYWIGSVRTIFRYSTPGDATRPLSTILLRIRNPDDHSDYRIEYHKQYQANDFAIGAVLNKDLTRKFDISRSTTTYSVCDNRTTAGPMGSTAEMMVSPPTSPDTQPRQRPQSFLYRSRKRSSSRLSMGGKVGSGSRASDEDGKTSVKVGMLTRLTHQPQSEVD